jgi:hypothetical protein
VLQPAEVGSPLPPSPIRLGRIKWRLGAVARHSQDSGSSRWQLVSDSGAGGGEPPGLASAPTTFTHADTGCTMTRGQIGVRTFNPQAAWRNFEVS